MIRLSSNVVIKRFIETSRIPIGSICPYWKLNTIYQNCQSLVGINLYYYNNQESFLSTESNVIKDLSVNTQALSIIDTTRQLGINDYEVQTLLKNQPDLLKFSSNLWNTAVKTLLDHGFRENDTLLIIEKCPDILKLKENHLMNTLFAWFNSNLGTELVVDLLTEHPYFLLVNHTDILKRIKQFQIVFESKKRVGKLLKLAPNLLEEKWSVILDKLNFLDELCTEKSDIAASGVLAHSLFHIKVRHEFLIRSGLYKRPKKDFHKRLSKNPALVNIVNLNDNHFVTNIARMTMFEYNVFLEMFKEELRNFDRDNESDED